MSPSPISSIIDRKSRQPLYKQVEQWLRSQIASGAYRGGDMLPSTKALSTQLGGINYMTIRQALSILTREGLLVSVHGRGTYVKERIENKLRIAFVLPQMEDEFTRRIADGMQEALDQARLGESKLHCSTMILDSMRIAQKEVDNIGQLKDLSLDGAVILPIGYGDIVERLVELKTRSFPFVLVDSLFEGFEFPSVTSDNYQAGFKVTHHLLEQGRKNLAWIGNCKGCQSARRRFDGFCDAINQYGLVYHREWQFEHDVDSPLAPFHDSMQKIVDRITREKMPIDAIVCCSDVEAVDCLQMLQERGVQIPNQMAITGIDDIGVAQQCKPSLTTIRQPIHEMGRRAAQLLLDYIQDPTISIQQITLAVQLVVRESSVLPKTR
jgi:GntR family transcriptional regulator of arabinose operon